MSNRITVFIGVVFAVLMTGLYSDPVQAELFREKGDPVCGYPYVHKSVQQARHIPLVQKPGRSADATFYVREDVTGTGQPSFVEVEFTRVEETPGIVFYVETSEWETERIGQETVDRIRSALLESTPDGSINPEQGIYENEVNLFGPPPDVDNNGKIFVLLLDVRDDYDPEEGGSYVAGYFDPADQTGASGNNSDILYIDTHPGLKTGFYQNTLTTVAHELQHLLHYAADRNEEVWLNEGMSEVTAHLLGYPGRSFDAFLSNPTRRLNTFDRSVRDYAKVGLWTYYLYLQYGEDLLHQVVQSREHGIPSLTSVFQARGLPSFGEVFRNWNVANVGHHLLPAASSPEVFRYQGGNIPVPEPALTISQFPNRERQAEIELHSASYIRLIGGMDITAQVFPPPGFTLDATLVVATTSEYHIEQWQGVSDRKILQMPEYNEFGRGWLILHSVFGSADSSSYTITLGGSGGKIVETLDYTTEETSVYLQLSETGDPGAAGTQYDFPAAGVDLVQAQVDLFNREPVTLELRETLSGEPLARQEITQPSVGWNAWALDTLGISLSECVFVVRTAENAVGLDTLNPAGHSYYQQPQSNTFFSLANTNYNGNWSMRLQVSYPDTSTDQDGIQWREWKSNPVVMQRQLGNQVFTSLELPEPMHVRIDVFNILGQHIKTITNETIGQGTVTQRWDGTNTAGVRVSSGMYLFRVQAADRTHVRKLTVIW